MCIAQPLLSVSVKHVQHVMACITVRSGQSCSSNHQAHRSKQRICSLQFAEEQDGEPVTAAAPKKDKVPYDQTIVNVDSEHSLVVVRASGGSTTVAMGPNSMSAQVAIGAFEIEDLLVGAVCLENSYLARSSLPAKEKFHDASSELTSMQRAPSEDSTASAKEEFHDAPDDLPASGEQGSSQALVMQYNKWTPQSPEYHDVDAQVHVKLKTLSFFCNRPTLGALMAIGDDVSATGAAKPPDAPAAAVQQPSLQEDEGQEAPERTMSNIDTSKLCRAVCCKTLDRHASIVWVSMLRGSSHILCPPGMATQRDCVGTAHIAESAADVACQSGTSIPGKGKVTST